MATVLLTMVAALNVVRVGLWVLMRENEIITGTRQVVHQMTSDLSPLSCVQRCSSFAWCLAVVTNYPVGRCELIERNVMLLNFSSSIPDTGFVHWEKENNGNFLNCQRCPDDVLLPNRLSALRALADHIKGQRARTYVVSRLYGRDKDCTIFFLFISLAHSLCALQSTVEKIHVLSCKRLKTNRMSYGDLGCYPLLATTDWCPVEDGFVLSPAAQFCFLVVDNITNNWIDNKRECERRGLTLVVPDTTLKMNILLNAIWKIPGRESKIFHIGASRAISDLFGRWTGDNAMFDWITGSRIDKDFLKPFWASGQPNNDNNSQHCLTVAGNLNNLLNDKECFEDNYFICEKLRQ